MLDSQLHSQTPSTLAPKSKNETLLRDYLYINNREVCLTDKGIAAFHMRNDGLHQYVRYCSARYPLS